MDDTNDPYVLRIDDLDDYSLIHIFTYLPLSDQLSIEKVCKRWKCLVRTLLRRLKTLNFDTDFHSDVREHTQTDSGDLQKFLQLCGNSLRCINLTHDCISNDVLTNIHAFCPKLEIINAVLSLEPMIRKIAKNMTNLTSFRARYQNFVTDGDSLTEIFDRNRKLSTLSLDLCIFRAESFSHLNHEILEILDLCTDDEISEFQLLVNEIQKLKKLRHFSLEAPVSSIPDFNLLNSLLTAANWKTVKYLELNLMMHGSISIENNLLCINHFKDLEELKIYAGNFLGDEILLSIARNCTKLKTLQLFESNRITDVGLTYIGNLLKIENLYLYKVDVSDTVLSNMKSLKVLKCSFSPRMTYEGLIKLLKTCVNLKTIEQANCSGFNLESLTDPMQRSCRDSWEVGLMIRSTHVLTVHTLTKVGNRISINIKNMCSQAFFNKTCNGNCTRCTQEEIRFIE